MIGQSSGEKGITRFALSRHCTDAREQVQKKFKIAAKVLVIEHTAIIRVQPSA
jgi:hypothetical protein